MHTNVFKDGWRCHTGLNHTHGLTLFCQLFLLAIFVSFCVVYLSYIFLLFAYF